MASAEAAANIDMTCRFGADCALVVIDVQNGFVAGGGLPVPGGEQVVPLINDLARRFDNVVLTQDWHPPGHASFAAAHPGKQPFETTRLAYGEQVLWPVHCVQGTADAAFCAGLDIPQAQLIVRKGFHAGIDSYSAFVEADGATTTGLAAYLQARGICKLWLCGLVTDFCVAFSALDARAAGFAVAVIEDATRAIDLNGSLAAAWARMEQAGVRRLQSAQLTEMEPA